MAVRLANGCWTSCGATRRGAEAGWWPITRRREGECQEVVLLLRRLEPERDRFNAEVAGRGAEAAEKRFCGAPNLMRRGLLRGGFPVPGSYAFGRGHTLPGDGFGGLYQRALRLAIAISSAAGRRVTRASGHDGIRESVLTALGSIFLLVYRNVFWAKYWWTNGLTIRAFSLRTGPAAPGNPRPAGRLAGLLPAWVAAGGWLRRPAGARRSGRSPAR